MTSNIELIFEVNSEDIFEKQKKPKLPSNTFSSVPKIIGESVPMYISQMYKGIAETNLFKNAVNPEEYGTPSLEIRLAKYGGGLIPEQKTDVSQPLPQPVPPQPAPPQPAQKQPRLKRNNVEKEIQGMGIDLTNAQILEYREAFQSELGDTIQNLLKSSYSRNQYKDFILNDIQGSV